jgi:acyl-CoA thioesterase
MTFQIDPTLRDRWRHAEGRWWATLPEGWSQGRSVFGGLTTAMAVALGQTESQGRPLRTLTTHLVRPTAPGEIEGRVGLIRSGRNVSFVEVTLLQGDKETSRSTLVFAEPNPAALRIIAGAPTPASPVEALEPLPRTSGRIPEFVEHVEMRWVTGQHPFTGSTESDFTGYCRFKVPAGGPEGLIALLDVWPAPPLAMLSRPAPASTVSWTAHLLKVPEVLSGWCFYTYRTVSGEGGYHTCAGHLYDAEGTLLAYSEQLVAVYG